MQELLEERESLWERLCRTNKPIFLYGMGDGADKILAALQQFGLSAEGVFASDEFVRGHSFRGYPVRRFCDIKAEYRDFVALLAFAVDYEPMLSRLYHLEEECEFYAPDVPVVQNGGELFDAAYVGRHQKELGQVYERLADGQSERVFRGVLNYKVSGKTGYLRDVTTERDEIWKILNPGPQETYVDLGAYNGDTVQEFLSYTDGRYRRIIAVEPDRKNYCKLQRALSGYSDAETYLCGAWSRPDTLFLKGGKGGRNSLLSKDGTVPVLADTVDRIMAERKPTLIKFDVEGAEAEALAGAAETIRRNRPNLMISAYHRNEDLFALPLQVLSYYSGYRVYLRHHPYIPAWETNYYFINEAQ